MKPLISLAALSLIPVLMGGCSDASPPEFFPGKFTGVVAEDKSCPKRYALADAAKSKIKTIHLIQDLDNGDLVSTKEQYPRVRIEKSPARFDLVFGANFGLSDEFSGKVLTDGDGPYFFIADDPVGAWTLLWGDYPRAQTSICNAAGSSTTILVQYISSTTHRVYFLGEDSSDSVTVRCGTATPVTISSLGTQNKGMYVEVGSSCTITPPTHVWNPIDGMAVENFVCQALQVAYAGGLTQLDAPGWPLSTGCQ